MNKLINKFFDKYGLSFVMVASYFGSGSVYIASQAGVEYGYTLVWAVVGAVILGFMAQDMSARLGIFGDTMTSFIRRKIGQKGALFLAIFLSIGCILWNLELTAAVGKAVEVLSGGAVSWRPVAVICTGIAILIGVLHYKHVEKVMTGLMFVLLFLYAIVWVGSDPDWGETAKGLIPRIPDTGALLIGVAILGTTALWPNFFLESNLVKEKGWKNASHLKHMRRDLILGYAIGGIITVAIVVVAAAVLRPAGYTNLTSFLDPGIALEKVLGHWAMIIFLIGVIAAAFNSIIPIMWTVPFMILGALDIDHKNGNTKAFKWIFFGVTALGALSPYVSDITGLSVIEMITLFPAFNGVFGLPITAAFLFWAVNDKKTMGKNTNSWKLNIINSVLVLFSIYIAISSRQGVIKAIFKNFL